MVRTSLLAQNRLPYITTKVSRKMAYHLARTSNINVEQFYDSLWVMQQNLERCGVASYLADDAEEQLVHGSKHLLDKEVRVVYTNCWLQAAKGWLHGLAILNLDYQHG